MRREQNKKRSEEQLDLLPPAPSPDFPLIPDFWSAAARRRAARRVREHAERKAQGRS